MEYSCKFIYTNSSPDTLLLVLEPWAEEHLLEPDCSVEVVGKGGAENSAFEFEQLDDRLIIYAWPGSIASVVVLPPLS
jgi:hypothetical protein